MPSEETCTKRAVEEIEQMTGLFHQKQRELLVAAARVEELSEQLDALRSNRLEAPLPHHHTMPSTAELERLYRELQLRNKLNQDQSVRLQQHRDSLSKRNQEVAAMDRRLVELRQRLWKKKAALQQKENLPFKFFFTFKFSHSVLFVEEIEQMTGLFHQKQRELLVAAARVEELSEQLDALRNSRLEAPLSHHHTMPSTAELERLYRELQLRNKLNQDQSVRLQQHRDSLSKRNQEVAAMDRRLVELRQRLWKKKAALQQKENLP
ncbi:unnamed protein product, partial [Menidia menidia]